MVTADPGRYKNAGHMVEPSELKFPGELTMSVVLTMPYVSAKPRALVVFFFFSLVFLAVLNVERARHILRVSFVLCAVFDPLLLAESAPPV